MVGGFAGLKAVQRIGAGPSEILVHVVSLSDAGEFAAALTSVETAQAARMVNTALRTRFIVSRGLRRRLLAACLGVAADRLEFREDAAGKPRLVGDGGWDFNLSHAGDYVAVAVRRGPVGIDLEQHRRVRDAAAIVRRYFHPDEAQAWQRLGQDRREAAFFLLWSAREAAMKCAGLGLARGMSVTRIDPALLRQSAAAAPDSSLKSQTQASSPAKVGETPMSLHVLDAPEGYTLVVAAGHDH